jgi:hypothetical protein
LGPLDGYKIDFTLFSAAMAELFFSPRRVWKNRIKKNLPGMKTLSKD